MKPTRENYNGLPDYQMIDVELKNKREMFAAIAMQAFIAAEPDRLIANTVKDAVDAADALIEALNK